MADGFIANIENLRQKDNLHYLTVGSVASPRNFVREYCREKQFKI